MALVGIHQTHSSMKTFFSLLLLAFACAGCSSTYHIQLPEQAKKLLDRKNGLVTLTNEHHYDADTMRVVGDSLAFTDKKTDSAKTVALRDIACVKRMSRSLAVRQGVVFTFTALGFEYIGLRQLSHNRNPETIGAAPIVLGGTLIGGVLGTILHSKTGSQESYMFNRDSLIVHSAAIEKPTPIVQEDGSEIRKVVKLGIDVSGYVNDRSGSFSNILGFSAGFLTGINLYGGERSQYVLGIDVSFTKLTDYRTNVRRDFVSYPYYYHHVSDERYQLSFAEIGLFPEYLYSLTKNVTIGFYGAASIGIGTEHQTVNEVSRSIVDSTRHESFDYGPYGEYNIGPIRLPYTFSIGTSVYYHWLMIDVKYRYTNMHAEYSYVKEFHNLYVQLGFVL